MLTKLHCEYCTNPSLVLLLTRVYSFCRPILNKAKPKPKAPEKAPEEPKKEEEKAPEPNGDADAEMPDLEETEKKPDMDVD